MKTVLMAGRAIWSTWCQLPAASCQELVAHTPMVLPLPPSAAFGTSSTIPSVLSPMKKSLCLPSSKRRVPWPLTEPRKPSRPKKNGSERGPATALTPLRDWDMPFAPVNPEATALPLALTV